MRILSKYKDYYDFLQGMYGIDNLVVLDRTKGFVQHPYQISLPDKGEYNKLTFHICGKKYECILDHNGKYHWGEAIKKLKGVKRAKKPIWGWSKWERINYTNTLYEFRKGHREKVYIDINPADTKLNEEKGCPILMGASEEFPQLEQYKIASVLPPEKIWLELYSWISKTKEEKDSPEVPDKEKVANKGFDKVWSFRNRKNKP